MTEQVKLEEYSIAQLNNICGNHDENFKMMVPRVSAPFNINFMLPVPEASLLALEVMNSALQVMIQNILKKQKK